MIVWDQKTEDAYESIAGGAPSLALMKLIGNDERKIEAARAALRLASMFDAEDWKLVIGWLRGEGIGDLRAPVINYPS